MKYNPFPDYKIITGNCLSWQFPVFIYIRSPFTDFISNFAIIKTLTNKTKIQNEK